MAISFPTSLDSFSNPSSTDVTGLTTGQSTVTHATQHTNANDAIEALEAKVGVNSSSVTTSLDYKVTSLQSQVDQKKIATKVVSRTAGADYECDGVADEVQINAAIVAVNSDGGGVVYLKSGTYNIADRVVIKSNVALIGEDRATTTIKVTNSTTLTGNNILTDGGVATSKIKIAELTIDGNKANQTAENVGIDLEGDVTNDLSVTDVYISRVIVKNCKKVTNYGQGIYIDYCDRVVIEDCICESNDNDGYTLYCGGGSINIVSCLSNSNSANGFYMNPYDTGGSLNAVNLTAKSNTLDGIYARFAVSLESCYSYGNSQYGIQLNGFVTCRGCNVYSNTLDGIYVRLGGFSTGGAIIQGNIITDNGNNGIRLDTQDDNVVSGNIINANNGGNTLAASNTYSGILLTGTTTRNVITGNKIFKSGGTDTFAYGIREASVNDDRNIITNNIVTNAGTANISTQGVNTDESHNITA